MRDFIRICLQGSFLGFFSGFSRIERGSHYKDSSRIVFHGFFQDLPLRIIHRILPECFQDVSRILLQRFSRDSAGISFQRLFQDLPGSLWKDSYVVFQGFFKDFISRILPGSLQDLISSRISSGSHFFQDLFRIAFQPGSHLQGFFQEFIEGVHQDRIQRIPPATRLATSQEAAPPALLIHRLHPTQHGTGFFNPSLEGRAVASHLLIPSPSRPLPTEGPHTDTHTHVPRL